MKKKDLIDKIFDVFTIWGIGIVLCAIITLMFSCAAPKTIVSERVVVKTDTLYKTKVSTDTFRLHDSVYVETFMRGDTVYKTHNVWKWRDRIKTQIDTVYKTALRTDTIRMPIPVEHRATWWEKTQMQVGKFAIYTIALVIFLLMLWLIRRKSA